MTIILTISDEKNPVHLLSDILLSVEGTHNIKLQLPHLTDAEVTLAGASTIAGLAQKTIVLGRTSALFAGDVQTAYEILQEFFSRSNGGNEFVALNGLINSMNLSPGQRSSVAIMTFYCEDENNIVTCGYNVSNTYRVGRNENLGTIQTVGSGSDDFVLNYQVTRNERFKENYDLYIDIIHRIIIRTIEPFLGSDDIFQHLYGAWFELSVFMGDKFEKLPMAIKFWYKKPLDEYYDESGLLIYSTYVKEDLFLTTVRSRKGGSQCKIIRVEDFFSRGAEIDSWSPQQLCDALDFNPKIFVQVLVEGTGSHATLRVCPYFISGDPLVSIERTAKPDGTIAAKVTIDAQVKALVNGQTGEAELTMDLLRRGR